MTGTTAYCGTNCQQCEAYQATQLADQEMLAAIAGRWQELFQHPVDASYILCDGCHASVPRHCGYCSSCEIRACSLEHAVDSCGSCIEFDNCAKMELLFSLNPGARDVLMEIRRRN